MRCNEAFNTLQPSLLSLVCLIYDPALTQSEKWNYKRVSKTFYTFGFTKYTDISDKLSSLCEDSVTFCRVWLLYNSFLSFGLTGEGGGELKENEGEAQNKSLREHLNSWVALVMLMHCSETEWEMARERDRRKEKLK